MATLTCRISEAVPELDRRKDLVSKNLCKSERFEPHLDPIVVTAETHKYIVAAQLGKLGGKANVLCEPVSKNTCPAITVAAMEIQSRDPEAVMLVLPSDHLIENQDVLLDAVNSAFPLLNLANLSPLVLNRQESPRVWLY